MASSSSSATSNRRHTATLVGGRLVTTLPLLPSKVYPPLPSSVPYQNATRTTINKAPLVLKVSPATSPKLKRKAPATSPHSLPSFSPQRLPRSPGKNHWSPKTLKGFKTSVVHENSSVDLWGTSECESGHKGIIHDIQTNFDGSKLATASEDNTVRVFEVDSKTDVMRCVATLRGHKGPVWKLAWADSSMGDILASASSDGTVKVWREGRSVSDYDYRRECWFLWKDFVNGVNKGEGDHSSDVVNAAFSLSWAPWTFGLALASGYSSGDVSVYSYEDDRWKSNKFKAHAFSVNAVSWAPVNSPSMENLVLNDAVSNSVFRFASCGEADLFVKIWRHNDGSWVEDAKLFGLMSYIKDVAWSPNAKKMRIAACGADMRIIIWSLGEKKWEITFSTLLDDDPWTISWSSLGDQLIVSQTDNQVFISNECSTPEKDKWALQSIR